MTAAQPGTAEWFRNREHRVLRIILILAVTAVARRSIAAAAAVTYGCVAAMNMRVRDLKVDGPRNAEIFRSTFDMGKQVSPYPATICTRTVPQWPNSVGSVSISQPVRTHHWLIGM